MNDMNNYDDELFFDDEEEIEEEEEVKQPAGREKLLKIGLIAVIVAVVAVVVLVVLLMKSNSGNEETTTLPVDETTTLAEETTTSAAEKYATGKYTVNVAGNGTLNLRKEASMDADPLCKIPNNTQINITEVKYDEAAADESSKYWGKASYLGFDGWVAMQYLAAVYVDNSAIEITTAGGDESTTVAGTEEASTKAPSEESTTKAPAAETTTVKEETTTKASSTDSGASGSYKVDSQGNGHLNMRDGHSVNNTSIAQIPDGEKITVIEVYENTDEGRKWAKVSYGGFTGWVAMEYLVK
mgnify:CR=1 FL=1